MDDSDTCGAYLWRSGGNIRSGDHTLASVGGYKMWFRLEKPSEGVSTATQLIG
jgi:hypothetical protein